MNKDDALVAEAVGRRVRCLKSGEWQYEKRPGYWTTVEPYISAPTAETDWIVLEWVQGLKRQDFIAWSNELMIILYERVGGEEKALEYSTLGLLARTYKPGDYAQALLAVTKDGSDG